MFGAGACAQAICAQASSNESAATRAGKCRIIGRSWTTPVESEKWHNSPQFAMDSRLAALEQRLRARFPDAPFALAPASEDSSFRRYRRVTLRDGRTFIAMDAPPEKEDCRPFVPVAAQFSAASVH